MVNNTQMGFLILTLTTPSVLAAAALGCTGQGSSSSPVPLPEAALKPGLTSSAKWSE